MTAEGAMLNCALSHSSFHGLTACMLVVRLQEVR